MTYQPGRQWRTSSSVLICMVEKEKCLVCLRITVGYFSSLSKTTRQGKQKGRKFVGISKDTINAIVLVF